ncbi:MAG: hypothetical protein HC827_20090 [Cyanobacteria bacterium RM1_2_2]|nr:hypothetical protein [Cyanobacteria bacterium RM1_2_2]
MTNLLTRSQGLSSISARILIQNPDDGSATALSLFWGTGAIRQMSSTVDHPIPVLTFHELSVFYKKKSD